MGSAESGRPTPPRPAGHNKVQLLWQKSNIDDGRCPGTPPNGTADKPTATLQIATTTPDSAHALSEARRTRCAAGWRSGWVAAEPWRSRPFRRRATPWRLPGFWRRRGLSDCTCPIRGTGGEGGRGAGRAGRGERDKGGSASSNRNTQRTSHGGACGCGGGTKTNKIKLK